MAKKRTKETRLVEEVFSHHFPDHPADYPPEAYRYSPASIRVRIVNKRFKGKSFLARQDMVDPIIDLLPEKTQQDLMIVLLLTPDELKRSVGNYEFEHPTPEPRLNHRKQPAKR